MKYVIAQYNNLNPFDNKTIAIGVVIQSENGLLFKFDLSEDRLKKIKSIAPNVDPETFKNLSKSFEENFARAEYIETSDELGNKIRIKHTDPKFLDYLNATYQTFYQYSEPKEIEGTDIDKYLELLYSRIVAL